MGGTANPRDVYMGPPVQPGAGASQNPGGGSSSYGGSVTGAGMPQGFQDVTLERQGLQNQDTVKQVGAPKGYKWDPVKGQYVRTPESIAGDMSSIFGLMNSFGGSSGGAGFGGGGGGQMPNIPAPAMNGYGMGGGAPGVPNVAPVNTEAAQSAAFGRAKDQVGQETSGALAGLRSSLGGRGMLGSGAESRGTMGVVNRGQAQLGDTSREQAIQQAGLREREGALNYTGGITQRGQTIGQQESSANRGQAGALAGYEGQIAQRGQNIAQQTAQAQIAAENARAQAAQRQSMLQGLFGVLKQTGSY